MQQFDSYRARLEKSLIRIVFQSFKLHLAKKENSELDISMRFVNILDQKTLNLLMTTTNENTTVSSASFAADVRSNQGDDGLIPGDKDQSVCSENQSVRGEVQSLNDGYRSSHANDQPMLEIGNRLVRDDEHRPMVVGNELFQIEN